MASQILTLTDLVNLVREQPLHTTIRKLSSLTKRQKTVNLIDGDWKQPELWWVWVRYGVGSAHVGRMVEVASLLWHIPIARRSLERETQRSKKMTLLDKAVERKFDPVASWLVQQGAWFGAGQFITSPPPFLPNTTHMIQEAYKQACQVLRPYLVPELIRIIKSFFPDWG